MEEKVIGMIEELAEKNSKTEDKEKMLRNALNCLQEIHSIMSLEK